MKIQNLAIIGLGLLFLMKNKNSISSGTQAQAVIDWQNITQVGIVNNSNTENILGNLNPYTGGPQTMINPLSNIPNFDYSPWGGAISEGGALFTFINGVNVRNPSADLQFVRGEGVYR